MVALRGWLRQPGRVEELNADQLSRLDAAYEQAVADVRTALTAHWERERNVGAASARQPRKSMMTELESQVRDVLSRLLPEVPATDRAPLVDAYIARRARADQDRMGRLWARLRPPSNEVPGLLALSTVLGRNDSIAVVLTRIDVFSSGLRLHVSTWGRPGQHAPLLPTQPELAERMGTSLASRPQISLTWNGAPDITPTDMQSAHSRLPTPAGQPLLVTSGGHGSADQLHDELWLTPRPPPTLLAVTFSWPEQNLSETTTEVPAAGLEAAAQTIRTLWPGTSAAAARTGPLGPCTGRHGNPILSRAASGSSAVAGQGSLIGEC